MLKKNSSEKNSIRVFKHLKGQFSRRGLIFAYYILSLCHLSLVSSVNMKIIDMLIRRRHAASFVISVEFVIYCFFSSDLIELVMLGMNFFLNFDVWVGEKLGVFVFMRRVT